MSEICSFCRREVLPHTRMYYEVLGWEAERKKGGTNALRLRSRTGAVAHWECVDRAAHGHAHQMELMSDPTDRMSGIHPTGRRE